MLKAEHREVLADLTSGFDIDIGHGRGWLRPMDLGGTDASPHSGILRSLVTRGLVERKRRTFTYDRPSYVYRITEAGREAMQRSSVLEFPVTDDFLDAPDGAVVDGYERIGDMWRLIDPAASR